MAVHGSILGPFWPKWPNYGHWGFGALLRSFFGHFGQILIIFNGRNLAVWGALFGLFLAFWPFWPKMGGSNGHIFGLFGHF